MRAKDRHPNFKKAACCCNCKHVFVYQEYDSGESFYCTLGALERPPCNSVLMGEAGIGPNGSLDREKHSRDSYAWVKWSMENEVKAGDACDLFKQTGT